MATSLPITPLRTFNAFDIDGSSSVTFEIKFIQENHYDEAINFMNEFFLADEPMARVRNFKDDHESMIENSAGWREILKDKISIACFKRTKDDEEIVAVNFLYVKRKSDDDNCEVSDLESHRAGHFLSIIF